MEKEMFYDDIKDRLFIKVANAKWEEEAIEEVPHRNVCDLAITYHIMGETIMGGFSSVVVTNKIMQMLGIDEEQLYNDAVSNSTKLSPVVIKKLSEMLGIPEEDNDKGATIVTNKDSCFGAAALFYPGMLGRINKKMRGNYYVLPSSKHEVICIKAEKNIEPKNLANMVKGINQTQVAPEDRLSDHVYYCHVKKGERLIDIVA